MAHSQVKGIGFSVGFLELINFSSVIVLRGFGLLVRLLVYLYLQYYPPIDQAASLAAGVLDSTTIGIYLCCTPHNSLQNP